jgi:hypothetical protein
MEKEMELLFKKKMKKTTVTSQGRTQPALNVP